MKLGPFTILKSKSIGLGQQLVSELTVLEWKRFFSLKVFYFHKTSGGQDRFHTHAFNAYSLRLWGNYIEEIVDDLRIVPLHRNRERLLFIPANQYHRITLSDGCCTILLTGRWGKEFRELREMGGGWYREVVCGEGRVDLREERTLMLEGK